MFTRSLALVLALNFPVAAASPAARYENVLVSGAVDRADYETSGFASAFMTLANQGKTDDRLLSVTCKWCSAVEIHKGDRHDHKGGMQILAYGIKLPAGSSVALGPKTFHIMLMNPRQPLDVGRTVELVLNLRNAGPVRVTLPVTDMCLGQPEKHAAPSAPRS